MVNQPVFGDGKICYVEIPALDVELSAAFYQKVFGWQIRSDGQGNINFDDGVGQVSGMWVLTAVPVTQVGLMVSIMVDDAEATLNKIVANGGKVVQPVGQHWPQITARFIDPAGNVWSIYQHVE